MKIPLLIATLATLGGCASSYKESSLPADHPANAAAMDSPPMERSRTLDLAAADPVMWAEAAPGMDHTGHGAREKDGPMGHAGHMMDGASQPGATPALAPGASEGAVSLFACPMHPEVTSDKPDQRCPKCNMKLKPAPKTGGRP